MAGELALLPYGARQGDLRSGLYLREWLAALAALPCQRVLLLLDCAFPTSFVLPACARANPGRQTVLLAAGERMPAPVAGPARSPHSPFAFAVDRYLREALQPGDTLHTGQLLQLVKRDCPGAILLSSPPPDGGGGTELGLRRPRLRLRVELAGAPSAGETFQVRVQVEGCGGRVAPVTRLYRDEVRPDGSRHRREWSSATDSFDRAGDYTLECVATDSATGEEAVRTLCVPVGERVEKPLVIEAARLPPCLRGRGYEAALAIRGGRSPYAGLEIEGPGASFPDAELQQGCAPEGGWSVRLRAFVPEDPRAGTPASPDASPTAYDLRVSVRDAQGATATARYRLPVFSPKDYCHIGGGRFEVGYRETLERNGALAEMLTAWARRVRSQRLTVPLDLQRMVRAVGRGLADEIVREFARDNPGTEVELPEFYMRRYPITNRAWRATPCGPAASLGWPSPAETRPCWAFTIVSARDPCWPTIAVFCCNRPRPPWA